MKSRNREALIGTARIVLIYALVAAVWILVSDRIAESMVRSRDALTRVQTIKGWAFVAATAAMLFSLIYSRMRSQSGLRQKLVASEHLYELVVETATDGICTTDGYGYVTYVNDPFVTLLGRETRSELIGLHFRSLVHVENEEDFQIFDTTLDTETAAEVELEFLTSDGKARWVMVRASRIAEESTIDGFVALISDITDRKIREVDISGRLAQKDELLREIHHRIKNNLQVIMSLIRLQSRYLSAADEPRLSALQQRVRSIALIHDLFAEHPGQADLDMATYSRQLVELVALSTGFPLKRVSLAVEPTLLDIDRAVPVALILNELLTNAMQHGAKESPGVTIVVELTRMERTLDLCVRDSGEGFPPHFEISSPESLGLQLVQALVRQLAGTIAANNAGGAVVRITIPLPA